MKKQPATYLVAGPHNTLSHKPGETFEALLEPILEERLLAAGALARVNPTAAGDSSDPDTKKEN